MNNFEKDVAGKYKLPWSAFLQKSNEVHGDPMSRWPAPMVEEMMRVSSTSAVHKIMEILDNHKQVDQFFASMDEQLKVQGEKFTEWSTRMLRENPPGPY